MAPPNLPKFSPPSPTGRPMAEHVRKAIAGAMQAKVGGSVAGGGRAGGPVAVHVHRAVSVPGPTPAQRAIRGRFEPPTPVQPTGAGPMVQAASRQLPAPLWGPIPAQAAAPVEDRSARLGAVIQGAFPHGLLPLSPSRPPAALQPSAPGGQPPRPFLDQRAGQRPGKRDALQLPAGFSSPSAAGGRPLPDPVRRKMERVFGTSFAEVRVHVGPQATAMGALAFTHGSHLYFAPGHYDPESARGQQLLGHELAHVVQQRAGRVRNPFGAGIAVVHDSGLEAEADRMGLRVATTPSIQPQRPPASLQRAAPSHPIRPTMAVLPTVVQRAGLEQGGAEQQPPQAPAETKVLTQENARQVVNAHPPDDKYGNEGVWAYISRVDDALKAAGYTGADGEYEAIENALKIYRENQKREATDAKAREKKSRLKLAEYERAAESEAKVKAVKKHIFEGDVENVKGLHAYTDDNLPADVQLLLTVGDVKAVHIIVWTTEKSTMCKWSTMFPKKTPVGMVCWFLLNRRSGDKYPTSGRPAVAPFVWPTVTLEKSGDTSYPVYPGGEAGVWAAIKTAAKAEGLIYSERTVSGSTRRSLKAKDKEYEFNN